jgi:hypothetical protein
LIKEEKALREKLSKLEKKYRAMIKADKNTTFAQVKINKADFVPFIDYAWVTFKSNKTPDLVLKRSKVVSPFILFLKWCCLDQKEDDIEEFDDQELSITKADEPDQIKWENLKKSIKDGGFRTLIVNIIAVCVAFGIMAFSIFLNGQNEYYGIVGINC